MHKISLLSLPQHTLLDRAEDQRVEIKHSSKDVLHPAIRPEISKPTGHEHTQA